jgi:hypothetical protein
MKLYLIEKTSSKRLVNLGGKIPLDKLNKELDKGNTVLIRHIDGDMQTDFRIRKVPQIRKMDRGYKTIKAFYVVNVELGKTGFDIFFPKKVNHEQHLRFHSLERAINMLEEKQNLKRADWLIDRRVIPVSKNEAIE